jgi:hypothetical protein
MENGKSTIPEHSNVVGGSTAERRIECPRSYELEKLVPKAPSSKYAREGTALHALMAFLLENPELDVDSIIPFTHKEPARDGEEEEEEEAWEFTIDRGLWSELGAPALDAFDSFIEEIEAETGAEFSFFVEKRCEIPSIEGAYGTTDIIWHCGNLSGVWDWKFGRHPVEAEENAQLMFYALAGLRTLPEIFSKDGKSSEVDPDREVILTIMQPKRGHDAVTWGTSVRDLLFFEAELEEAITTAQKDGINAPIAKGDWCRFAPCKAVCPLYTDAALTLSKKILGIKASGKLKDAPNVGQQLPELLDLAANVEDWIKEVRSVARLLLESDPQSVNGWMLTEKQTRRREWGVDQKKIVRWLRKEHGLRSDQYNPRRFLSVPQIEKLGIEVPEGMISCRTTKTIALVKENSDNEPVKTANQHMKNLAESVAGAAVIEG